MKTTAILLVIGFALQAYADVDPTFRRNNATVLYDFNMENQAELDAPQYVIDRALPSKGAAINLEILAPASATRFRSGMNGVSGDGTHYLRLDEPNLVRSLAPATKLIDACRASGALSYEVWLENNENVQPRAGFDAAERVQPLRILNLSRNLNERNFVFGQFYDMGNFYVNGARTRSNENSAATLGNSLTDPLQSTVAQTIVPDPMVGRVLPQTQKVVFTLGRTGVSRLYLSDLDGYMYLAQTATTGFGTGPAANQYFDNWFTDAFLTLGNVNPSTSLDAGTVRTAFTNMLSGRSDFAACGDACVSRMNRYWKGKLKLVAVYCQELTREQVLGAASTTNVVQNVNSFEIKMDTVISKEKERAMEIFNRITGAKTSMEDPRIAQMATQIEAGNGGAAAAIATADPRFLNYTVRDFADTMSNRAEAITEPLNDFSATIIGYVRENYDARGLLSDNRVFVADPALAPVPSNVADDMLRSNNHYLALEEGRYDLARVLKETTQKLFDGTKVVDNPSPAGLLTTRQWMKEHAIAGTDRRLVEYTFREFLCSPMESIADSTGTDSVIGPDIDRQPGGSHTKFTTTCRACHTILDGFRPAYARWTFGNGFAKHAFVVGAIDPDDDEDVVMGMQIDPRYPKIAAKINKNEDVFPEGRRVTNEAWVNNARSGSNAVNLKMTTAGGTGLKEFGEMISNSPKFGQCLAERVFKQVCKRDVLSSDYTFIESVAKDFRETKGRSIRFLFERIVASDECLGGL